MRKPFTLVSFSSQCNESSLKKGRVHFDSQFEDMVHHGGEVTEAGT